MEKKYDIKKTTKNSIEDFLDIKKRNIKTNFSQEPKKIFIYKEELENIINDPYSELVYFMNRVFVKYNYSPIINKLFNLPGKEKETDDEIEKVFALWLDYVDKHIRIIHREKSQTFAKKIMYTFTLYINQYLIHLFSIPKISESLNIINKKSEFKIYNFDKNEEENNEIYLDIEKELRGYGCTFIFLKELKRLYDGLKTGLICFNKTLTYIFFHDIENVIDNVFYMYVTENEVVSSLLYQIKLIFELNANDNKDVLNLINKFTIDLKKIIEKDNKFNKIIEEIYSEEAFLNVKSSLIFKKEYEEICKNGLMERPKKVKYNYQKIKDLERDYKLNGDEIEYQEDEKIKQITDIDELTKYIQGDGKKKKKRKKKKKENPINMLDKLNFNDNNLEDDQISMVSHDTIVSNFKKDIRNDNNEDKDIAKRKPILSDKFLEDLE